MKPCAAPSFLSWLGALWLAWTSSASITQDTSPTPNSRGIVSKDIGFSFTRTSYKASVYENSVAKVYIDSTERMGVSLSHASNLDVEFTIVDGDSNNIFKAESVTLKDFSFLRIRTQTVNYWMLNRELNGHFQLRVKARASLPGPVTLVNYTLVNITVLDKNEFSPMFSMKPYQANIREDTGLYESIGRVSAFDADDGVNGDVYFSLVSSTDVFAIHPTSGVVSLTRPVRYDLRQSYDLEILAQDRGDPSQSKSISPNSKTQFKVNILPVNFNPPTISISNHQSLVEHGNIGAVFAVLTVTDNDHGDNGEIDVVAITNDPRRIFSLVPDSTTNGKYTILVVSPVDRETIPDNYNMTVAAVDKGSPPRTASVVIPIRVQDINDNAPEFERSVYSVEISEVAPVNTPVTFVTAHDKDLGDNAQILYSIIDGNNHDMFTIDPKSGLIRTSRQLDAETDIRATLTVHAQDQATSGPRKTGQTRVVIQLKDYNDNAPIFNMAQNHVVVKENLPVGSRVTSVLASDDDSADNGRLSYSIVNYDTLPFEIDAFTGEITTKEVLDFETMRRNYDLHLRVSDWGTPFRREEDMVLTVRLEDMNDNSPEFEKIRCTGYLSRESALKMDVITLTAIDFDSGDLITYSIIDGNQDGCFSLASSTGAISVNCDMSSIRDETRVLTVVASDGQHVSISTTVNMTLFSNNRNPALTSDDVRVTCQQTDVTVRFKQQIQKSKLARKSEQIVVLDKLNKMANNIPQITKTFPIFAEVSENADVGTVVVDFSDYISDNDDGYNGQLVYVISGGSDHRGAFKLDTFTGELQVLSKLDFEDKPEYSLTITASDLGQPSLQVSKEVRIMLQDENDNAPQFEKSVYVKEIMENSEIGYVLLQVKATDLDTGINSDIRYSIISDSPDFSIDPLQGIIQVKRLLDREQTPTQILTIQAKDSGTKTQLASCTIVNITILDMNDNAPVFYPGKHITAHVREDLPIGTIIATLVAHDVDLADNGRITYSFANSGSEQHFGIDGLTGAIRIKQFLDYELQQVYNMIGLTVDNGQPAMTSTCLITVEVMDVNENRHPPVFPDFLVNGTVAENLPIGSYVMHIQAEDLDDGNTGVGQVFYTIQDGTGLGRFSVDINGTIRTSQVLDRETTSHYWLTIIAQDRALVPQFARLELLIKVLDVNEKIPLSVDPVYRGSVEENNNTIKRVVQIQATDGDDDGAHLHFSITAGNSQQLFTIDPDTGVLSTTNKMLDREKQDEHSLEVTISDQGSPPLSSTTRVVIKVNDDNDNRPEFIHDRRQHITVFARPYTNDDIFIYRAVAYDPDEGRNADITYSIRNPKGSQFRINPDTGSIYSTQELLNGDHELTVVATDNGITPRKSQMRLDIDVVPVSSRRDNKPRFSSAIFEESITETDKPGQMILLLTADDTYHEKLRYDIVGGNEDHRFTIQPDHGSLFLAQPVDYETKSGYNLTVSVSDGITSDLAMVLVRVIDVNDNEPVFTNSRYYGNVSESVEVGSEVLRVMANDLDRNKVLLYTIESAASTRSLEKFSIGAKTGVIEVIGSLDREVLSRHLLTVMVRDQGIPSKRSYARVEINILDHNDHPPRFQNEVLRSQVYETAALGTSVLQVMAIDEDKGHNAEITYSIVAGNAGNIFVIDEKLGIISVAKELDRQTISDFEMIISAADHGQPQLTGTSTVKVTVTVSTNSPPRFQHNFYPVEIQENLPPGTHVISMTIECLSTVIYAITAGDDDGYFTVNPNSGSISTMKAIDFEKIQKFNLTVSASNIVSASQSALVIVHVLDVNDNAPTFVQTMYTGNISERALPGTIVLDSRRQPLAIKATDNDSKDNARLFYQITDTEALEYFSVDSNTGAIHLISALDFETKTVFHFSVQVNDLGIPKLQAWDVARVVIYVDDVNDNPPKFSQHSYQAMVILPTFIDVSVMQVLAVDPDTVFDKPLSYSIANGNENDVFRIDTTKGIIYTQKESLTKQMYNLTLQAEDGKFMTVAMVTILVQQQGDTTLKFTKHRYFANISENESTTTQLTVIQPVGLNLGSHVTFTLLNNLEFFTVGQTSGVVTTAGLAFDREKKQKYTVVVRVVESRTNQSANVIVDVSVQDKNDNPPMFVNLPYQCTVSGDAKEGEVIQVVKASDPDLGENGEVKYSLANTHGGKFAINAYTREIVVKKLDERDHNTQVVLKVIAQDKGSPSMTAEATIHIHITDSISPLFEQLVYNASIQENAAPHSPVIALKAISPHGQKLIYSISTGDKYGVFALDFNTGYLSLVDPLDYETMSTYKLTVRATDVFTGRFAETTVNVDVEDINDNPPVLTNHAYTQSLLESTPLGVKILTVLATDADRNANAVIHYELAPSTPDSQDTEHFVINSQTGVITLRKELDHERQEDYQFLVVAKDGGIPLLSSTALINVKVEDINDNAPVLSKPTFSCFISDAANPGHLVIKIMALDPDKMDTDKLVYSIIDGNERQTFSMDSASGIISLSEQRRPVLNAAYVLTVSVSDGIYSSLAKVSIDVRSINHNSPVFGKDIYEIKVPESQSAGSTIITATAIDGDRGNYGMITYTIVNNEMSKIFSIDAYTGEMTLRQVLDREQQSLYRFTIAVTDDGGRMGYAIVVIQVGDENDNVPQFLMQEYRSNIASNASIGTSIMKVQAEDGDEGHNAKIVYTLVPGQDVMVDKLFKVDSDTGLVTTKASLTAVENQVYQFFVQAMDQGTSTLESNVPVEILVMGNSSIPPRFADSTRLFFVNENEQVGTIIATVKARSLTPVKYSIIPGFQNSTNRPMTFSVDEIGQLRLQKSLDRETTSSYTLFVRAETKTLPPLMDYMEIVIQVRDVNDNTPVFACSPYLATLPENTRPQHSIIQLIAHDIDLEVKPLKFFFGPGMTEMASLFSINSLTGWITLLAQLDREKQDVYNLTVMVSDTSENTNRKSGSMSLTSTTNVIITVTDINDNSPKFERDSYATAVNEGALSKTVLAKLEAKDADILSNSVITYYITGGDNLGQFGITSSGQLEVNKGLDREAVDRYTLTVAATDGTFVSYVTVHVDVLDDNDNAPICLESFQKVELNEDIAEGTLVTRVQATDADESGTVNARLEYSLENDGGSHFVIDKNSGLIRTVRLLDREVKSSFLLVVVARDGGGLSCSVSVLVVLRDVNDNPPVFGPGSLRDSYSIQEDAHIHTLLTRVTAQDADTGINSHISYRLVPTISSSVFSLDPDSGIISLVASLDREKNPSYNLTIVAFNPITPDLFTETTITVLVLDVNDNPPEFEHTTYRATLEESAPIGAVVKQVKATSLDVGVNADITYSIIAGNDHGTFAINPNTGMLTVAKTLDYELSREYFISVLATDHGDPPLTNTAVISINITDINDNPPRFSQDTYAIHVSESVAVGTEIFKVMATDSDSLPNAKITYSILQGNSNNQFVIHPHNGILKINSPLDREDTSSYSVIIQAHDSGLPMLFSSAVVSIIVDDSNDNPPIFSQDVYKGLVQEGRRTGIETVTVSVSDADLPENGAPFSYEITKGNDNGEFHIDSGGVIRTAGKLSKKAHERYNLTVRAYDNGKPALYSDALVEIEVVDESLYAPEIQDLSVTISSCVGSFLGGVIGQIQASDRDPYDKIIFSIVSPNNHLFDIHRYDGRLIALTGLDAGNYVVNISASDGKFTSYGKANVHVSCASKEMLDDSLTIQFENMVEEQFYANFLLDFQRVLKQELDVRTSDVEIINVQPSVDSIAEISEKSKSRKTPRTKRSVNNNLDVLFVVHKPPDKFYNKKALKKKIERIHGRIESVLGVKIVDIFYDKCNAMSCDVGTCVGKIHFDDSTLVPVLVNGASYVSARHRYTQQCICLEGDCAKQCGDTMCSTNKVCQKNAFGDFICQCSEGRTGSMCETVVPLCNGNTCPIERPMTFAGKSYAKWKIQHSTKKRFSLKFRFRTRQKSAMLMFAKGKVDYSILKIDKGSLLYIFDCGSGEGQVQIPVDLSDGQWHLIELDRHGREAELSLDSAYTAIGVAPGIHAILNVESEEIYFGAEVDVFPNGYKDVRHGFEGCMEDIRVFNVPLPFTGLNEVAQALQFEQMEFHCQDFPVRVVASGNVCSSSPCLNGAQCKPSGINSFICVCSGNYRGQRCELDPDPCRNKPCKSNGQCEVDPEVPNSFLCQCNNHLTGVTCGYGKLCRPNPCKQGGTCIEGPTAPLCDCAAGSQGMYCEKAVDGCSSNPCQHGSTCRSLAGGMYTCNCTPEFTGRNCEIMALKPGSVTSSSSSMFYGIIGAGIAVFIIVILVVACLVVYRRKRDRQRHIMSVGLPDSGSEGLLTGLKDKRCKLSNPELSVPVEIIPCQPPPQPPPVPTRPASYTPSTHDSLNILNNLDSVGNYGSAADDLENTGLHGHIPDFYQYLESYKNPRQGSNAHPLLRATPPPLGSRTASESDSIQKAPWEFEYPNILENYMEGDKKQNDKMAKQMPGIQSPQTSPTISHSRLQGQGPAIEINSISSFNVSEDDINTYHWDTSDWAPGPSRPNISEIATNEISHSPSSSQPSDDCNANADNLDDNITTRALYNGEENNPLLGLYQRNDNRMHNPLSSFFQHNDNHMHNHDFDGNIISQLILNDKDQDYFEDSEYVEDSEYAENEPYEQDLMPPCYTEHPNYEQLLHGLDDSYELPGNLNIHPNKYLPEYKLSHPDLVTYPLTDDENVEYKPHKMTFVPNSLHQHDYPPLRPPKEFITPTDGYNTDQGPPSRCSFIDNMSMSLGALASNTSFSDISGLCEIVDSEMSATDTDDENTPCLTPGQLQTQV